MKIMQAAALVGLVGSIAGGVYFIDNHYVSAADWKRSTQQMFDGLKKLGQRLDQKIIEDRIIYWQRRRDDYVLKAGRDDCGQWRAECLEALRQVESLKREMRALR